MPQECPLLHDKGSDRYYNPSKASHILFECDMNNRGTSAVLEGPGFCFFITEPDAILELRRWCDKHTGSW